MEPPRGPAPVGQRHLSPAPLQPPDRGRGGTGRPSHSLDTGVGSTATSKFWQPLYEEWIILNISYIPRVARPVQAIQTKFSSPRQSVRHIPTTSGPLSLLLIIISSQTGTCIHFESRQHQTASWWETKVRLRGQLEIFMTQGVPFWVWPWIKKIILIFNILL